MTLLFFSCQCWITLSDFDGAHKQNKCNSLTQLQHTKRRQSAVYRFRTEVVLCGSVSSPLMWMDTACRLVFGLFPYRAYYHRRQNPTWQRS